jgi:hypothetical protein
MRVTSMAKRAVEQDCRSSGATDGAGASGVTVDTWRSMSLVSYFPYPTGSTEETDTDTVIKKRVGAKQRSIGLVCRPRWGVWTNGRLNVAFPIIDT